MLSALWLLRQNLRTVTQRDIVRLETAIAPYEEADFLADLHLCDRRADLIGISDLLMVHFQNDVSTLQSRSFGWTARLNSRNDDAFRAGIAEVLGKLLIERPHLNADVRPGNRRPVPSLHEVRQNRRCRIDRNREPDGLSLGRDHRVNTDYLPFGRDERAARIPRVDGSRNLDHVVISKDGETGSAACGDIAAMKRRNDTEADRVLERLWFADGQHELSLLQRTGIA